MKHVIVIALMSLAASCVREAPIAAGDAADTKAKTAPVSRGSGVLASDFDADTIAPDAVASGHDHHQHADGAVFTCPHHPDVVRDKPGTCPKCGMDLVPKKPEPKAGDAHEHQHGGH